MHVGAAVAGCKHDHLSFLNARSQITLGACTYCPQKLGPCLKCSLQSFGSKSTDTFSTLKIRRKQDCRMCTAAASCSLSSIHLFNPFASDSSEMRSGTNFDALPGVSTAWVNKKARRMSSQSALVGSRPTIGVRRSGCGHAFAPRPAGTWPAPCTGSPAPMSR